MQDVRLLLTSDIIYETGLSKQIVTLSEAKGLIASDGDSSPGPLQAQDKFRMTFIYFWVSPYIVWF
jgi:hypothetical protein